MEGEVMRPTTKLAVGDRWHTPGSVGATVVAINADGTCDLKWDRARYGVTQPKIEWLTETPLHGCRLERLGGPPATTADTGTSSPGVSAVGSSCSPAKAAPVPVDWGAYLPPRPLPHVANQKRNVGDVWATCWPASNNSARVIRFVDKTVLECQASEALACRGSNAGQVGIVTSFAINYAVLICRAGETPPPPAEVWARAYGERPAITEAKPGPTGAAPGEGSKGPAQPPTPTAAPRREVSANGRDWVAYDRLTDADPFESWPWRREGTQIIVPRPPLITGSALQDKVTADIMRTYGYTTEVAQPEPWRPSDLDGDIRNEWEV